MENTREKIFKSGFVTILGRPNVGKSTLLNALVKSKVSIVSSVPQTTRFSIRGVLNLEGAQIVFVDTPGIYYRGDSLAHHLNTIATKALEGVEEILYVVDVSREVGRQEEEIMDVLVRQSIPVVMGLNKIDLGEGFLNDYINLWEEKKKTVKKDPLTYYIAISAKTGKNLERLIQALVEFLPQNPPFYSEKDLTDFPLKFRIADIIREKLFLNLKEELPFNLAVEVQDMEDKGNVFYIQANIYVNRDSQKGIIIGRNGKLIKDIGEVSRREIEGIVKKKVYLQLWVKVLKMWQRNPRILKELGYS